MSDTSSSGKFVTIFTMGILFALATDIGQKYPLDELADFPLLCNATARVRQDRRVPFPCRSDLRRSRRGFG